MFCEDMFASEIPLSSTDFFFQKPGFLEFFGA
jgi:hypothetical protein